MASAAFVALDGAGLARVDFFVGPDEEITLNEVNTMPGFTEISMFGKAWAATGWEFAAIIDRLVQTALKRGTGLR
jgi:D-alanine-D-alanine ligase